MSFKCLVITPEQQLLDETVTQVTLPAYDGQIGILTDLAPLLVKLGVGEMHVSTQSSSQGKNDRYLVDGGVAQMKDNVLTVLTQHAVPASELHAEDGVAALAEATARRITDQASFDARQHDLEKARAIQRIAAQ